MNAVYIQPIGYPRACRLLTIGTDSHVTGCLARIPADEPVVLSASQPAEMCSACRGDIQARTATVDLRPNVLELGNMADVLVADPSSPGPYVSFDSGELK